MRRWSARGDTVLRRLNRGFATVVVSALTALVLLSPGSAWAAAVPPPRLQVTGAALLDADTGQVLYGVSQNAELAIASTTKLMTALVTLQHVPELSRMFTQNNYRAAPGDSQIGLVPGERMSVHDLLLALMLPSADDAAEDLAYNVGGGSVPRFLSWMNADARALGLTRTHYATPSGLDTPGNYSSPLDLVRLAAYDLSHFAFLKRVVATRSAVLHTGRYPRLVVNLNDLLGRVPWINGVKTGYTTAAGHVLVASGTRDGMTLIGSVLGTPSIAARDSSALALLRYGFAAFRPVQPIRAGQLVARLPVQDQSLHVPVTAAGSFERAVPRSDQVRLQVRLPRALTGPLARGARVGQATVIVGGRAEARIPLVVVRAVPAPSLLAQVGRFLARPITLLLIVIVIGALALGGARRRRRQPRVRGTVEER